MTPTHSDSIRLFRFSGIQVYLHWSWFVIAIIEISSRMGRYASPVWNVAEYLMLFAIVTMHEFGHALACRQTGGQAHEIVLWPLGGIAFVAPPQRPGATLWSIAAGPLVNVALVPVFYGLVALGFRLGWAESQPDLLRFLWDMKRLNSWLLVFNLLPIYPLDGGQILRSLLWFVFGRARSLKIAAIFGLVGVAVGALLWIALMVAARSSTFESFIWPALLALFAGQRCLIGLREAKFITALERLPRHTGFACPSCDMPPPGGPLWLCARCRQPFDPFSTNAVCPHCQTPQPTTACVHCGADYPIAQWRTDDR